jgi:hypothetical protein
MQYYVLHTVLGRIAIQRKELRQKNEKHPETEETSDAEEFDGY